MTGRIFEIKRFAVHDGDGIRTTVFFKGCPLRCIWCHNPEGLSFDVQDAFYPHKCIGCGECRNDVFSPFDCLGDARVRYGRTVTVDELLPLLLEDREFYESSGGGITLSGGECLMQADFCLELLHSLKDMGIHTAVDTSGYVSRDKLRQVIPYTDIFLYDIKAYNKDVHARCTGKDNEIILDNLKYLSSINKPVEIRIPYVPGHNDGEIEDIAHFLSELRNITKIRLLPYHNYAKAKYSALGMEPTLPEHLPSDSEMTKAASLLADITGLAVI